jgi:hypothetical protein
MGGLRFELRVLIPYGRATAQHHFAHGNKEGDTTLCGRNCYGWSDIRAFEGSDAESAYSCKHCLKALLS